MSRQGPYSASVPQTPPCEHSYVSLSLLPCRSPGRLPAPRAPATCPTLPRDTRPHAEPGGLATSQHWDTGARSLLPDASPAVL